MQQQALDPMFTNGCDQQKHCYCAGEQCNSNCRSATIGQRHDACEDASNTFQVPGT